ncbi:LysM peptidoglycan-binding domain-containing protein [Streptococcus devriesei]|uniref:LysM peptidoglycan-binding domain-containing protein n=1 Tax=Streptococcus devriesei TaxID=231233 RepID=UPI0003FA2DF1|nr:LysM domain-containing protein [Streptococcus devriesei]
MKFNQKMLLASTLALSLFAAFEAKADDKAANWAPRTVEEVKTDLVSQGNQTTYTVQYGDTLSTIADAMSVDVNVLAKVNQIANINLIFPGTTITASYDAQHNVTGMTIEGADNSAVSGQSASVNFSTNEVTVGETTTSLDAVETPAAYQAPAAETTVPTEQASSAQPAASSAPVSAEQPAVQSTPAQATAPVAPTAAQTTTAESASAPAPTAQTNAADTANSAAPAQTEAPAASQAATTTAPAAPAAETEAPAAEPAQQQTSVDTTGLQPSAANFANKVANTYGATDIGGVREGDSGDHGTGNAVDVMVYDDTNLGKQVADYATSTMAENNISYVIYQQKFYGPTDNVYGPANTWNQMPDRGSDTANHMDHVHVSFNN